MVHTEVQIKNGIKYYYRTLSYREGKKFHKLRKYLGKELDGKELLEKEKKADLEIELKSGKLKKVKIGEKKLYKQSGAGLGITICLPGNLVSKHILMDNDLEVFYKGDLFYCTPDLQFYHYFIAEDCTPTIQRIFERIEKNKNWMSNRIDEFNIAVIGFEALGEQLISIAKDFSKKNKEKTIKIYEKFLEQDYSYWKPSLFIDMFDTFEEEILNFIFRERRKDICKEDLHILLLPDKSIYWEEKADFNKLQKEIKEKRLEKTDELFWTKLKKHANKYWWIKNDYQHVQKLTTSDFLERLNEAPQDPFWEKVALNKQAIIKKYNLDKNTISRLKQITDMAYLRDIRKQYTQIANYYVVNFFHIISKTIGIPIEWANFVAPFKEYEKFLSKDSSLMKELKSRTETGFWIIGNDVDWTPKIESKRALELLKKVEGNLKKESILYGNVASLGKARGIAKIVLRQSDFDKFNEGDILITGMTRPEFVPLMKKASAIVTDEGGITCHAAIISRELNKPCVIATQNSTKTFKDGDLVEVNANHGFIKNVE